MKQAVLILFITFSFIYAASADDAAPSGHLQRAPEKTADQVKADRAAAAAASATPAPTKPANTAAPAKASAAKATETKPATVAAKTAPVAPVAKAAAGASSGKLPAGVPAGAVKVGEFSYAYTDKDGKQWIYNQSPFGWSRTPREELDRADAVATAANQAVGSDWKMTESGDEVHFEQPTPFGGRAWTKKKSELTSDEQAVYERLKKK